MNDAPSVVCAWCRVLLIQNGPSISHGICARCRVRVEADARRRLSDLADS